MFKGDVEKYSHSSSVYLIVIWLHDNYDFIFIIYVCLCILLRMPINDYRV